MPRIKLTSAAVERLKAPASGQVDYFDTAYPGLALRVSAKGVRSWVYLGRVHGTVRRATLGRWPVLSLAAARQKAGQAAESMRNGVDVTAEKRAARVAVRDSFEAVADDWLKRDQSHRKTYAEVKRVMDRDVKPVFARKLIHEIGRRDVIELIDGIVDRGAVILARRVHAHLHRLFRWCVGRGILEANPMTDLPKPGKAVKRDRVLSDLELGLAYEAAGNLGWPFASAFRLLMLTGARREEIGGLQVKEIDGATLRLEGARTKNGEPHAIPLSAEAQVILDAAPRIKGCPFVFTTTGKTPVSGWSRAKALLDREIANLVKKRKLKVKPAPWRLHDLRRTLATGLQRLGFNLQVIESALGHITGSRGGIVGVYQRHSFEEEKRAALEAWARHVVSLNKATKR